MAEWHPCAFYLPLELTGNAPAIHICTSHDQFLRFATDLKSEVRASNASIKIKWMVVYPLHDLDDAGHLNPGAVLRLRRLCKDENIVVKSALLSTLYSDVMFHLAKRFTEVLPPFFSLCCCFLTDSTQTHSRKRPAPAAASSSSESEEDQGDDFEEEEEEEEDGAEAKPKVAALISLPKAKPTMVIPLPKAKLTSPAPVVKKVKYNGY